MRPRVVEYGPFRWTVRRLAHRRGRGTVWALEALDVEVWAAETAYPLGWTAYGSEGAAHRWLAASRAVRCLALGLADRRTFDRAPGRRIGPDHRRQAGYLREDIVARAETLDALLGLVSANLGAEPGPLVPGAVVRPLRLDGRRGTTAEPDCRGIVIEDPGPGLSVLWGQERHPERYPPEWVHLLTVEAP